MEKERNIAQVLAAVRMHYESDLLSDFSTKHKVRVKLLQPAHLKAKLRGMGDRTRELPFTGGEIFVVIGVESTGDNDMLPSIKLRLKPTDISDVQYLMLDPTKVHVVFDYPGTTDAPYHELMRTILESVEPSTGKTNGQLIDAVIAAERKRHQRGQIESHAHFGEW